jgi:hypothetical protein
MQTQIALPESGELREWNADFAFDVSVAQAEWIRSGCTSENGDIKFKLAEDLPNSYVLHEHLVRDKEQWRLRIKASAHVFTTLIKTSIEDGLAMTREEGED